LKRYDALVDLGGRREAARISSLCGWCGSGTAAANARAKKLLPEAGWPD